MLATRSRDYINGLSATRYIGKPDSAIAVAGINQWVGTFAAACNRAVADATALKSNGAPNLATRVPMLPRCD